MMTESEKVIMPTAVLRDRVSDFAGGFLTFLHRNIKVFLFVLLVIVVIVVILKLKTLILSFRAKRLKPESTNEWFDWKEFGEWQEKQKRE